MFNLTAELFSQTLPLILLQQMNNSFLEKWDGNLDTQNIVASALNVVDLVLEVTLMQLMSEGNAYHLLNKEHLGFTLVQQDDFKHKPDRQKRAKS